MGREGRGKGRNRINMGDDIFHIHCILAYNFLKEKNICKCYVADRFCFVLIFLGGGSFEIQYVPQCMQTSLALDLLCSPG